MNLGEIYIKSGVAICIGACLLTLLIVLILRFVKKTRRCTLFMTFCLLAPVLSVVGDHFGHGPLFVAWHRAQNTLLPESGCLTYKPSFFRLYATYRMSRAEFEDWATHHPWQLVPMDEGGFPLPPQEVENLGLERPEAAYASEPAPNGRQLRVYYAKGTMYVAYYVM